MYVIVFIKKLLFTLFKIILSKTGYFFEKDYFLIPKRVHKIIHFCEGMCESKDIGNTGQER